MAWLIAIFVLGPILTLRLPRLLAGRPALVIRLLIWLSLPAAFLILVVGDIAGPRPTRNDILPIVAVLLGLTVVFGLINWCAAKVGQYGELSRRAMIGVSIVMVIWILMSVAVLRPAARHAGLYLSYKFRTSTPVRKWRCYQLGYSPLARARQWTLNYLSYGSMGGDNFYFSLDKSGTAQLIVFEPTAGAAPGLRTLRRMKVPRASVARIEAVIDDTGAFCQAPIPRWGTLFDIGHHELMIAGLGRPDRSIFFDETTDLPDRDAMGDVIDVIRASTTQFRWSEVRGPMGAYYAPPRRQ